MEIDFFNTHACLRQLPRDRRRGLPRMAAEILLAELVSLQGRARTPTGCTLIKSYPRA